MNHNNDLMCYPARPCNECVHAKNSTTAKYIVLRIILDNGSRHPQEKLGTIVLQIPHELWCRVFHFADVRTLTNGCLSSLTRDPMTLTFEPPTKSTCDKCEKESHHHLVCRVFTVSIVYDEEPVVTKIIPDTNDINVFDECSPDLEKVMNTNNVPHKSHRVQLIYHQP